MSPREPQGGRRPPRGEAVRRMAARAGIVLPQIVYPPALPVSRRREEIASAIYANQVVIVAGETGSGKTTQLPKILLELGRGRVGQIGHTQPRRIAARTVAERIAEELDTPLGEVVGYQVRFTDTSSDSTMVKVMTDGILLAEIQRDPQLWAYDTIIVDEAHERSLNIDFLLGYLTNLAPTRPDLKLIITSATIDSQLFAKHFAHDGVPAPIVEVTGRTFPVEIRYHPLDVEPTPWDQPTGIVEAVRELMREGPGDILVFCSGEREIRDAADALVDDLGAAVVGKAKTGPRGGAGTANVEVLPLYTRLSAAEQHRVFEAHAARRVVLATNIAETSLTVPGIHYVVDPGTARISRYSKATKVQRLPIEAISQASANQRAGRCGRLADGICIRLYSEEDFGARPEYTEPEILRTSLASVILRMIAVGVAASPTDISAFPFVQPPDPRGVRDGMALLAELGAIAAADSGKGGSAKAGPRGRMALTGIGHTMAEIPIDPRLARMIVEAGKLGVVREATILAAALSIQDVRERPIDRRGEADAAHARFADSKSDFLTYLNLWEYLRDSRRELSSSAFRRAVRAEFLNYLRIREWQDLVTQLRRIVKPLGLTPAPRGDISRPSAPGANPLTLTWDASAIHRALLPGLLSQIGMRADTAVGSKPAPARGPDARDRRSRRPSRNEYVGARGTRFAIFPGSPLSVSPPPWIMAAELVETSRLWARDVAGIDPAWAEAPAGDLVRRVYAEPRWSAKRGAAIVSEKVLLYGLAIVPSRAVPLERTDPGQARELFIRRALVDGEWRTHHRFFHANRELLEQAEQLVQRTRNRSLAVDPEELFAFYDARVPASATSARRFDAWWKKARGRDPELLTLSVETLGPQAQPQLGHGFPDVWIAGDFRLSVTYEFAPGSARDGATVHIPIAIANQIPPDGFDWQVPGLRADLVAALIKSLPKRERVHLVPAPDTARAAVAQLGEIADWREPSGRIPPLTEALGKVFRETRDVIVPPEAWNYERVPDHLRLRFAVENRRGETMAAGLDLAAVVHQADPEIREAIAAVAKASGLEGGQEQADAPTADDAGPPPAGGAAPVAVAWPGERERVTTWDFGDLPSEIRVDVGGGVTARGYPALVVEDGAGPRGAEAEHVALRVVTDPARAVDQHARGVRTLLCRELGLPTGRVTSRLPDPAKLALASWRGGSVEALIGDIQSAAVDSLMAEQGGVPRTQGGYAILRGHLLDRLEDRVYRIALAVAEVLRAVHGVEVRLGDGTEMAALNSVADIRRHLDALVAPGFVTRAGEERLPSLRRYAAADAQRLDHLGSTKAREQQGIWLVEQMWEAYRAAVVGLAPGAVEPPALREIPWMIEELRVSLFAQQLGTAHPVSEQRIRRAIAAASTRGERR